MVSHMVNMEIIIVFCFSEPYNSTDWTLELLVNIVSLLEDLISFDLLTFPSTRKASLSLYIINVV